MLERTRVEVPHLGRSYPELGWIGGSIVSAGDPEGHYHGDTEFGREALDAGDLVNGVPRDDKVNVSWYFKLF